MPRDSSSRRDESEDLDYEIVEDEEKPRRKSREEHSDAHSRRRKRDASDEIRPRPTKDAIDDDDERPLRKKKKKKKRFSPLEREDSSKIDVGEWIMAGLLFSTGLILCFASALGIAPKGEAFRIIGLMLLGVVVTIPITVVTLMVTGMALSIDYGEWKIAIVKLAAISTFNNGLIWLGQWLGIPMIMLCVCVLVCFGLFMSLFELDTWETNASLAAINIVQFVARMLLFALMMQAARHEARKQERGDDNLPANVQPNDQDRMPDNPRDEPDPPDE